MGTNFQKVVTKTRSGRSAPARRARVGSENLMRVRIPGGFESRLRGARVGSDAQGFEPARDSNPHQTPRGPYAPARSDRI
jgi:hypothetical protein